MNRFNRIYIYAADVAQLTGKCLRTDYVILKQIRLKLNKEPHQLVTFDEFYEYMGAASKRQSESDKQLV